MLVMASAGFITGSPDEPRQLHSGNLAGAQLQISAGGKVKRSRVMLENAACLLKENSKSTVIVVRG